MTYEEAIDYIHSIPRFVRPLGNKDLGRLLELFCNPQDKLKFIHIAGTNGKGSTAAMLSSILCSAGYTTGLFTSPFIEVFNERIKINGHNIPDDDLCEIVTEIKGVMEANNLKLSEFAFITAAAFVYFEKMQCDVVVLETGMGGRLDATNIIKKPVLSVITSIGLDHMEYLGNTVEEIAKEKCGIIKPDCPVISQDNGVINDIINNAAKELNAPYTVCKNTKKTNKGFLYNGIEYPLSLQGEYQAKNGALTVLATEILNENEFNISENALYYGLKNALWPVRFEFVRDNIVIDGAHNIDGTKALIKSLKGYKFGVVTAMMADKSTKECIEMLRERAEFLITTEIDMPRCQSAEKLKDGDDKIDAISDFKAAISEGIKRVEPDSILCICGSLYFAAQARKYLKSR